MSFLFDARRRLVAIYKGPVPAKQVQADFSLLTATDAERRIAASPDHSGHWADPLGAVGVKGPYAALMEAGLRVEAEKLLLAAVEWYGSDLPNEATPSEQGLRLRELSSAQQLLATLAFAREDFTAAEQRYLASIAAIPTTAARRDLLRLYMSRRDKRLYPVMIAQLEAIVALDPDPGDLGKLGVLLLETGQASKAVTVLEQSTAARPEAMNFFQLGQAHRATGSAAAAAEAWTRCLKLKPDLMPALNNFAWLRATCPDAALRDGTAAVAMAEDAAKISGEKNATVLGTLAVAQAEAGRFADADATATKAVELAKAAGQGELAAKFAGWRTQFQRKEAIRE